MKVILRENIDTLGKIGDIVRVSDGYARNFLLPRNLATIANEGNVQEIEHHQKSLAKKREKDKQSSQEVAKKLEAFSCTIARKVGEHDKLFGSVTTVDIADTLKKAGFKVDKRTIVLDAPIKALGVHSVSIKLEPEVSATVKVWVVKEE